MAYDRRVRHNVITACDGSVWNHEVHHVIVDAAQCISYVNNNDVRQHAQIVMIIVLYFRWTTR